MSKLCETCLTPLDDKEVLHGCVKCHLDGGLSEIDFKNNLIIRLKQNISDQQALIEKQAKAIGVLKEANDFYKEESDWNFYCNCCATGETKLEIDHGKKAREAKKQVEEILANEN